ncbi:hypothetical protein GQ457_08G017880 [Hibiscus cannabinus]
MFPCLINSPNWKLDRYASIKTESLSYADISNAFLGLAVIASTPMTMVSFKGMESILRILNKGLNPPSSKMNFLESLLKEGKINTTKKLVKRFETQQ